MTAGCMQPTQRGSPRLPLLAASWGKPLPNVTIENHRGERQTYPCRLGLGLQGLAAQVPTPIEFDCREADCGICIVRVLDGLANLSPHTKAEADFLKAMRADPDERLACQCRVMGDVSLKVEDA